MDLRQRTKRFGWNVILCACVLRLMSGWIPAVLNNFFPPTYSETGRNVRFSVSLGKDWLHTLESPAPWIRKTSPLSFSREDMGLVQMDYDCALRPDLEALLTAPLSRGPEGEGPGVLILHTHTTESYTKAGETYEESSEFRTLSEEHNMISVGERVAEMLEAAGIGVIHDRTVHDYPSYNGSYVHARTSTEEILKANPSVRLILDLHRDALETGGRQLRTAAQVKGRTAAQLMLVVGTNVSRPSHTGWEENLSLALKLQVQLERMAPGIMRPVNLRRERFNQDLGPGALLIEVGAAGNSRAEALAAAEILAEGIIALWEGSGETWEICIEK